MYEPISNKYSFVLGHGDKWAESKRFSYIGCLQSREAKLAEGKHIHSLADCGSDLLITQSAVLYTLIMVA